MTRAIHDRRTFGELRRAGRRTRRGPLTVTHLASDPGTGVRVGYAIGRPVGTAVVRNRLRRRLRVIVARAENESVLPDGALLIGASRAATDASTADLDAAFRACLDQLRDAA